MHFPLNNSLLKKHILKFKDSGPISSGALLRNVFNPNFLDPDACCRYPNIHTIIEVLGLFNSFRIGTSYYIEGMIDSMKYIDVIQRKLISTTHRWSPNADKLKQFAKNLCTKEKLTVLDRLEPHKKFVDHCQGPDPQNRLLHHQK